MKKSNLAGAAVFISMAVNGVNAANMAYVEVNSNNMENTACYVRSDTKKPYFDIVSIFAANINGKSPDLPEIYFNSNVSAVLNSDQVANLQKRGMKVLVTLLGNHENAGWACMTDPVAAKKFANAIVSMVNNFHLDGIDIDDEYSICKPNNYSITMIAQAIKSNPAFKGKLLTKALFNDYYYFKESYNGHKLSEYLDYGWEMSYSNGNFDGRLAQYLQNGMTADRLMLGGWASRFYPDPFAIGQYSANNHLAGVMVYDITKTSQDYLSRLLRSENDQLRLDVLPGCLQDKIR